VKIGALAQRTGLRPSAIRYYESIGLLPAPVRRGAHRVYGADALERLRLLKAGQALGFTLSDLAVILRSLGKTSISTEWRRLATRKIAELERTITAARALKRLLREGLDCGCVDAASCTVLAKIEASAT
jgi:MerR family redox-sensitive transcriptional activator SoxR